MEEIKLLSPSWLQNLPLENEIIRFFVHNAPSHIAKFNYPFPVYHWLYSTILKHTFSIFHSYKTNVPIYTLPYFIYGYLNNQDDFVVAKQQKKNELMILNIKNITQYDMYQTIRSATDYITHSMPDYVGYSQYLRENCYIAFINYNPMVRNIIKHNLKEWSAKVPGLYDEFPKVETIYPVNLLNEYINEKTKNF